MSSGGASVVASAGEPRARRSFTEASAVRRVGEGIFEADADPGWAIGGRPNGGYLLAMLGRASTDSGPHDTVLAASAQFAASPEPGPLLVTTELVRAGRTTSQVHARLSQGGRVCVDAIVTTGRLDPVAAPRWTVGVPERPRAGWHACAPLDASLPDGRAVEIRDHVEVRLDPATAGFTEGRPSGHGELRGWVALRGHDEAPGAAGDPAVLLFALDSFPPATFDIAYSGWVPTLALSAYIRALPAPGPLQVLQRAQLVQSDLVDEVCTVWDSSGRLVAQGTQLAGVRLP